MKSTIIHTARKILYPDCCPGCGKVLEMDQEGFCPQCRTDIHPAKEPSCKCCGRPLGNETEAYCTDCKKTTHLFRQNKAYCTYQGGAKQAMYRFKYGNARWVGEWFAKALVKEQGEWLRFRQPEIIIPVPVHPRKKRERGYNQAEVLANFLAEYYGKISKEGCPPVVPLVRRSRYTTPQKELSVTLRRKNLKKAFKLDKNVVKSRGIYSNGVQPVFQSVLIVDDIYTTGATLDAMAELLLAGRMTQEVYAMTAVVGQNI